MEAKFLLVLGGFVSLSCAFQFLSTQIHIRGHFEGNPLTLNKPSIANSSPKRETLKCVLNLLNRQRESELEEVTISREEQLITLTKRNARSLLNKIDEPELLADDFQFVAPVVGPLKKDAFMKAFKTFTFTEGFPDVDPQLHDFRIDPSDPSRVWYTSRATGTHRGDFTFLDDIYPATGIRFNSPPECSSMKWSDDNKCIQLTTGYVMDKLEGNTGGLGAVFGVLYAIGAPLPVWLTSPPGRVLASIIERSPKNINYKPKKECALSTEAMFGLTRQVVAQFPNLNSGLLTDDFVFSSPMYPQLNKQQFLKKIPQAYKVFEGFPDYNPNPTQIRIDAFDAARVNCVITPTGTNTLPLPVGNTEIPPTNRTLEGMPESVSIIFNDVGQLVRLCYGYPMDRLMGNTGGLAGVAGVRYAMGVPIAPFFTRPALLHLKNWRNYLLEPVDNFFEQLKEDAKPKISAKKSTPNLAISELKADSVTVKDAPEVTTPKASTQASAPAPVSKASPKIQEKPALTKTEPEKKPSQSGLSKLVSNLSPSAYTKPKEATPKPEAATKKVAPKAAAKETKEAKVSTALKAESTSATKAETSTKEFKNGFSKLVSNLSPATSTKDKTVSSDSETKTLEKKDAKKQVKDTSSKAPTSSATPENNEKKPEKATAKAPEKKEEPVQPLKSQVPKPAPKSPTKVNFSPKLEEELKSQLGQSSQYRTFVQRTNQFTRGAISARNYQTTLASSLRTTEKTPLISKIIDELPDGSQKKALVALYSP